MMRTWLIIIVAFESSPGERCVFKIQAIVLIADQLYMCCPCLHS